MLLAGLTGGIGAGKSAVSDLLSDRGAVIVDADVVARQVVEPGTSGLERLTKEFGTQHLRDDGSLDRVSLGRLVFSNPEALERLNGIVHPLVRQSVKAQVQALASSDSVVIQVVPLLVESGQYQSDVVIVVDCEVEVAVRRLVEIRGLTEEEAKQRIAAQTSREQRLAAADIVIENNGSWDQLVEKVDACWLQLQQMLSQAQH